jgi:hypothetical protein
VAYSDWEPLVEVQPDVFQAGPPVARRIEDFHPSPEVAMLTGFWVPLAALLYRRSIVQNIGAWQEWLPVMQDGRFFQDAVLVGASFVHVRGVGARYRVRHASQSRVSSQAAVAQAVFRNTCDAHDRLRARGRLTADQCRALAQIYDQSARYLFFQHGAAFRECVARLYQVEPGFRPSWPKVARPAARLIGVRAAGMLLTALTRLRSSSRQLGKSAGLQTP